jgi:DNA-binding transcriptional regulator YiaG
MCNIDRDTLYCLLTRERKNNGSFPIKRSKRTKSITKSKISLIQNPLVRETLLVLIGEQHQKWTLAHYCDALYEQRGMRISVSAMGLLLKKLGHRQKLGRPAPRTRNAEGVATRGNSDTNELRKPRFIPPKTDIRELRLELGLSQVGFSRRFHLPLREVRGWETGEQKPSGAVSVLLFAIKNNPEALENALRPCA